MPRSLTSTLLAVLLSLTAFLAPALAEESATVAKATVVLGLETIKRNAKGKLTVEPAALVFASGTNRAEVSIPAIADVFTGDDSKRMIGGPLGTLTMFGPYGSGRFLSLFRTKVDVLTVEYRDAEGGLHGAIFMLPWGKATALKKELIAKGAHASLPVEEEKPKSQEEKKP